jgi:hypothetical protein
MPDCHQCGKEFSIDQHGVATHLTEDEEIDHDADADHVPYTLKEETFLRDCYELGDYGGTDGH